MTTTRLTLLAAATALSGCATDPVSRSLWPPQDFSLEVRALDVVPSAIVEVQKIQFAAGGLVVYRESTGQLDTAPFQIPLYTVCAVYELDERSVRMLTRLLGGSRVFEPSSDDEVTVDDLGRHVVVQWTANGSAGTVSTLSEDREVLEDALHIVNAFLPASRKVLYQGELPGQPEPRHVEETPEPADSIRGALACHLDLVRRRGGDDLALLAETFALALESDDREIAEGALKTIRTVLDEDPDADPEFARRVIDPLRELLRARWPTARASLSALAAPASH